MKKLLISWMLLSIFFGCKQETDFTNGNISMSIAEGGVMTLKNTNIVLTLNKNLHASVNNGGDSITDIKDALMPLNFMFVNGGNAVLFEVDTESVNFKNIKDEHGDGSLVSLSAYGSAPGDIRIKQDLEISLYKNYSDMAVLSVNYTNLDENKKVTIDSTVTANLRLNSKLTATANKPYDFHAFQGASQIWGDTYATIPLTADYNEGNFMGLYDRYWEEYGVEGGGINVIDVWNKQAGISISHLAMRDLFVYFPTVVDKKGFVNISMTEKPDAIIGDQTSMGPGETYAVQAPVAILAHEGDFYHPLETYKNLLVDQGVKVQTTSPDYIYRGYWKTWGWRRDFTLDMVYERIPYLLELGITQVMIDDGWFEFSKIGDWEPIESIYPNGESDIIASIKKMKSLGAERVYIWWNPLGAGVESNLLKDHKDWLVLGKDGEPASTIMHSLCPAYPPVQEYLEQTVRKFFRWGYDGVYNDFAMNSTAPLCYNPVHKHNKPTDAFAATPKVFEIIWNTCHELHADPFVENCICSLPHSLFKNPYTNMTSSSDPTEIFQIRARVKVEKATHGPTWAYNTHIEQGIAYGKTQTMDELDAYFATIVGTGTVFATLMGEIVPERFEYYKKWYGIYYREMFSDGAYLNLYDVIYDTPETHVVNDEGTFYYGIYEKSWDGDVELRGLEPGVEYQVIDYVNNTQYGKVQGPTDNIKASFDNYLLIKCVPM